jgi:hypothetical protein
LENVTQAQANKKETKEEARKGNLKERLRTYACANRFTH